MKQRSHEPQQSALSAHHCRQRAGSSLTSAVWILALVGLTSACTKARDCTDEEVENQETSDCSTDTRLVVYTAAEADSVTVSQDWSSGLGLTLQGDVRGLIIERGAPSDEIRVSYRAETELLDGRPEGFVKEVMKQLEVTFKQRGSELVLDVKHPDTSALLGANLRVQLPDGFDSALRVQKFGAPGDVVVEFLADARSLDVDMEAASADLLVNDTGTLTRALLNVAGNVYTAPFANPALEQVAINSEEGSVETAFDVVPLSHATIINGLVDGSRVLRLGGKGVSLALPRDSDFTLATDTQRKSNFIGADSCDAADINAEVRRLICGNGDVDGKLTFDLRSGDDIRVELR